jgi:pimeloyl-ACP methyl ester carboxylesterase
MILDTHSVFGQGRRLSPALFADASTVATSGGAVRYRRARANGPRFLFGVDGPNVLEQYGALFAALEGRADVTVFEPPGTGASAPAPGFPFTFSAFAAVTREVLSKLELGDVTLVFPCYLGFIATLLDHPSVVIQTPAWSDMARWTERVDRPKVLRRPVIGQLAVRARRPAIARLWYRSSAATPERAQQLAKPAVDVLEHGGCFCLASLVQGLAREPYEPRRTPKLLVWGPRDRTHRASHPETAWPGARVHRMETCGHSPELEEPEAFAEALLAS